jgi:hypothetical protein
MIQRRSSIPQEERGVLDEARQSLARLDGVRNSRAKKVAPTVMADDSGIVWEEHLMCSGRGCTATERFTLRQNSRRCPGQPTSVGKAS